MDKAIDQIIRTFESEEFDYKKCSILNEFVEKTNRMYLKPEEEARTLGFTITRNETGLLRLRYVMERF